MSKEKLKANKDLWSKAGREVWEIKPGDILYSQKEDSVVIIKEVAGNQVLFNDEVAVRFQRWAHINRLKVEYKVACFVEDRVD